MPCLADSGARCCAFWEAARAARTVYRRGYEGLGLAWGYFMSRIEVSEREPAKDLWGADSARPDSSPDLADRRRKFNRPLMG
jgi:hypothetical protein